MLESSTVGAQDWRAAIRDLRILCIGNGGLIKRDGRLWTQGYMGGFLGEMGSLVRDVCFCAWLDPSDDPLQSTQLQGIRGVRALGLPYLCGSLLKKLIKGTRAFTLLAKEILRADFVYLYWPGRLSSVTSLLCRALRTPYGIYFRGEQIPPDPTLATAFKHARFVIAAGEQLQAQARVFCKDVECVTPMTPVRAEHIVPPRSHENQSPFHILYVGRIEERKGVHDLLAAACYLEQWRVPFKLTMVGHSYDTPSLFRRIPTAVAEKVQVIEPVTDFETLASFYRSADMFILPSHDEGFPRVLYEAMAFGLPIVTTFVGSIPSVMKDQQNCLRIEPNNPADIAEKLNYLVTNPAIRAQIAAGGHQCISELVRTWGRPHSVQVAERLFALDS